MKAKPAAQPESACLPIEIHPYAPGILTLDDLPRCEFCRKHFIPEDQPDSWCPECRIMQLFVRQGIRSALGSAVVPKNGQAARKGIAGQKRKA